MGWGSAGEIFEPVANALIRVGVEGDALYEVCRLLIEQLQEGDWDTEGDSLVEFLDYPEIVEAFKVNGVEMKD